MSSIDGVDSLIGQIQTFLEGVLPCGRAGIVVAFSGGPDSTALLSCVITVAASAQRPTVAAYFNHHLRGNDEALREEAHAVTSAQYFGVPLCIGSAAAGEIEAMAAAKDLSIEEAARIVRYEFLEATADTHNCCAIATGHTRDDLVETLIQRFFQGAGVRGLKGIPRISGRTIRPLLAWSRDDVHAYIRAKNIEPFEDPSNRKNTYLRNKIRNILAPAIEDVFPGFRGSLVKLSQKMAMQSDYVVERRQESCRWDRKESTFTMKIQGFASMHPVERVEAISALVDTLHEQANGTLRIPFGGFRDVISLPPLDNNRILFRWGGIRLQIRGDMIFLEPDVVFTDEKGYFTLVNASFADGPGQIIKSVGLAIRVVPSADAGTALIPVENLVFPFIVRSRRGGDSINLGGTTKVLKKLYSYWKVPDHMKWKIAVCEDRKGIAAVIGSPFGFDDIKRPDLGVSESGKALAFRLC